MAYINGVDISSNQGEPDLDMMASKADFVIMRRSIGAIYDKKFDRNWAGLAGKTVRGIYYVPHPDISAELAKAKLRDIIALNPELPIALDVEIEGVYVKAVYGLAMYIYQKTGRYPMIYTSPGFWGALWEKANKTHEAFFKNCPLWVANYKVDKPGSVPPWGENWTIWQYAINSADAEAYGLRYWEAKAIDVDWYRGDDLSALCGGEITIPSGETTTEKYVRVKATWLRLRREPSLYAGDTVVVGQGVRLRVTGDKVKTDIEYWPVELDGYSGYVSAAYVDLV